MGPTRMLLGKPVIAAVEGHAVAGGLELALWCDLRVAARDAVFGVYCRRWGVPLVDGGTVRLPRLIGHSHALDLILTGRGVSRRRGACAWAWPTGSSSPARRSPPRSTLAQRDRRAPQRCLRNDRLSAATSSGPRRSTRRWRNETELGLGTYRRGETPAGAARFAAGAGRHGADG